VNKKVIIGIALIALFTLFGFLNFRKALTPYVSYREARSGGNVQVIGTLVKGSINYAVTEQTLYFTMKERDVNDTITVAYRGRRPINFEEATSIVAIGSFDGRVFQARKLLVKCPSKYQGTEIQREFDEVR
jgi:cytochrome c-type biogenesis protein CcmE